MSTANQHTITTARNHVDSALEAYESKNKAIIDGYRRRQHYAFFLKLIETYQDHLDRLPEEFIVMDYGEEEGDYFYGVFESLEKAEAHRFGGKKEMLLVCVPHSELRGLLSFDMEDVKRVFNFETVEGYIYRVRKAEIENFVEKLSELGSASS